MRSRCDADATLTAVWRVKRSADGETAAAFLLPQKASAASFFLVNKLARATDREPSSAGAFFFSVLSSLAKPKTNGKATSRTAEEGSDKPQHVQRGVYIARERVNSGRRTRASTAAGGRDITSQVTAGKSVELPQADLTRC